MKKQALEVSSPDPAVAEALKTITWISCVEEPRPPQPEPHTTTAQHFLETIRRKAEFYGADMPIKMDFPTGDAGVWTAIDEALKTLPAGWRCSVTDHLHPAGHNASRVTFFGPEYRRAEPVETATVRPRRGESLEDAFQRTRARLFKKYGWRVYMLNKHIYHPKRREVVEVWRPGEWLEAQWPQFSPVELVDIIKANVREVRVLERPAAAGRKMFDAQAQRRAEWQSQRQAEWAAWQAWIADKVRVEKWSFAFAQRKAANHFGVSLKSMQRRTKKPGQAD